MTVINLNAAVPAHHLLRAIKQHVDAVLRKLSPLCRLSQLARHWTGELPAFAPGCAKGFSAEKCPLIHPFRFPKHCLNPHQPRTKTAIGAGGEFTSYTIKNWLETWIAGRTDASKATQIEYKRIIGFFVKYLGARGERALTTLQPSQIEEFRADLAKRVAPSIVNKAMKVLKASVTNAVAKRQLEFSPAEHVTFIETEETNRRPFTSAELTALLGNQTRNGAPG